MTRHPVEKLVSFESWSRDHPGDQIPGDRLDLQFDNHRLAIEALRRSLDHLLRADGKLNHDLITPQSLPGEITSSLVLQARREVEEFVHPVLDRSLAAQAALAASQLAIKAMIEEARQLALEARQALDQARELGARAELRVQVAAAGVQRALEIGEATAKRFEFGALDASTAENWSYSSMAWAEFMDGNSTIPADILATNGVTGDHWSSRWWANRAAGAAGMLAWWYQGAWPQPGPPSTPADPTGKPLPPGAIYWDTTFSRMMVWNGSAWVSMTEPVPAVTQSLYYLATAGQTAFPFSVPDRNGATYAMDAGDPEGVLALVNGVRLEPVFDYTVNPSTSTVTFLKALPAGVLAIFDILVPQSALAPAGAVGVKRLNPIAPDGTTTHFAGLTVVGTGTPVNVARSEELQVSVDGVVQQPAVSYTAIGATIDFVEAPAANAVVFMLWFGPAGA